MFEKVNPSHPDKVADRIAGAIVDLAYKIQENPKIAVEVLIGHGECNIIIESSVKFQAGEIADIVKRITHQDLDIYINQVPQDIHLAENQKDHIRCGDNGIFKGVPVSSEELGLTIITKDIYKIYQSDGKYILDEANKRFVICQSNASNKDLQNMFPDAIVNPLGEWEGGTDVDCGATNRKLGSDMGQSVTGGGLHGKDLSKADVSVNIYAWLKAQKTKKTVELSCAIGDDSIDGKPYSQIVDIARIYIKLIGGFEKFAEYGLIGGLSPDLMFQWIK